MQMLHAPDDAILRSSPGSRGMLLSFPASGPMSHELSLCVIFPVCVMGLPHEIYWDSNRCSALQREPLNDDVSRTFQAMKAGLKEKGEFGFRRATPTCRSLPAGMSSSDCWRRLYKQQPLRMIQDKGELPAWPSAQPSRLAAWAGAALMDVAFYLLSPVLQNATESVILN